MTFLNPFLLLGLVAAGIPLVIHLFNFRRPKRVDFSSLSFVRELQKTTMQRVRLKQWLLLLLRTLAIGMLVLAFARPTLTGGLAGVLGGNARSSVALVLDNSASMELRDAGGAYLEQARVLARAVVDQLEPGDELLLFTTAGQFGEAPTYQTRSQAREAVDRIDVSPYAMPARDVLNRAVEQLSRSQNVNREIFFISDLQSRTLGDSLEFEAPPEVSLVILPVGQRAHTNVAIEDVRVVSRIVEAGAPVRLEATVRSFGGEAIDDYSVSAFLGDERVAQAPVDLKPGSAATVSLVVTPQEHGWLGGRIEGEDDAFARDNVRFFSLNVPERRRLLLVRGEGTETRYLRLALNARQSEDGPFFDVQEIDAARLPNALARLGEYDAVALSGVSRLGSGEAAALSQYVENGGGLLLAPGPGGMEGVNVALSAVGGGAVSGIVGEPGGAQAVASFGRVDADHALFEGVFEGERMNNGEGIESPSVSAAAVYRAASGREQTLIQLTSGSPFLQEIRHGLGVAFFYAVALNPAWSDLPVRGLFVPLLYRSLQYLSASEAVQGEEIPVGGGTEIRLAGVAAAEPVRIVSPFGEETIPEQRVVPGAVLLSIAPVHQIPGIYEMRAGDRLLRRVASNFDRAESDLTAADATEFAAAIRGESGASVRVLPVPTDAADRAGAAIRAHRSGVELWNVFLLLALCFLFAEMIVARRWRPETVVS